MGSTVEEAFKLLKYRIEVENFSGKTAMALKPDFYAKMFLLSLCAAYAHPIAEKVIEEYKANENRRYDQKINRTNAIAMTKDILIAVFIKREYATAIRAYDDVVKKNREIIRPCRLNERNHRPKKLYSMNYKKL